MFSKATTDEEAEVMAPSTVVKRLVKMEPMEVEAVATAELVLTLTALVPAVIATAKDDEAFSTAARTALLSLAVNIVPIEVDEVKITAFNME